MNYQDFKIGDLVEINSPFLSAGKNGVGLVVGYGWDTITVVWLIRHWSMRSYDYGAEQLKRI
jgi:hypothetical protein